MTEDEKNSCLIRRKRKGEKAGSCSWQQEKEAVGMFGRFPDDQ